MDKIFVYEHFDDCNSFEFSVRIGSPKSNSKIEIFNPNFCPEFESENEKMSEWTEWDSIADSNYRADWNYQNICKPEIPTGSPEITEKTEIKAEIECLFPNANICLKIEHLIIIIGALVLILVLTCITFICIYNKNRRSNNTNTNYSNGHYLQMNKKNNVRNFNVENINVY